MPSKRWKCRFSVPKFKKISGSIPPDLPNLESVPLTFWDGLTPLGTALQLYKSTTLQPDSSTTLQLYNTTAQSTALQLYSPAPLQLHLYNATTLQPYNSAAVEL